MPIVPAIAPLVAQLDVYQRTPIWVSPVLNPAIPDGVKRPQMQWNPLTVCGETPMFDGFVDPMWMYFVHSYAPATADHVVATCDYGGTVVAAVERGRLWATQFHPEKSGANGLQLLANFLAATGS